MASMFGVVQLLAIGLVVTVVLMVGSFVGFVMFKKAGSKRGV